MPVELSHYVHTWRRKEEVEKKRGGKKKVSGRVSERDKERVFKGVSKQQNGSPPHTLRSIMMDTA